MHLERTIWPVGHGGFYTEQFYLHNGNRFTIAYDCGARNEKIISNAIDRCTSGGASIIDLLFISHLHYDHTNGLAYLLNNHWVGHIILPQLTQTRILEAIIYNFIFHINNNDTEVGTDREEELKNLQSILIGWANGETENITEVSNPIEDVLDPIVVDWDSLGTLRKTLPSNTPIYIKDKNAIWQYRPVCYIEQQQYEDLKKAIDGLMAMDNQQLIKINGDIDWDMLTTYMYKSDVEEKGHKIYTHLNNIKNEYIKIFKPKQGEQPHNSYSMPVYSGPLKEVFVDDDFLYYHWRHYRIAMLPDFYNYHLLDILAYHSAHCLYTGDFEANDSQKLDKVQKALSNLWAKVGLLQIPHHVSDNNYNPDLYDHRMLCFGNVNDKKDISFSFSTFNNIIYRNHCIPLVITENSEALCLYYDLYV